jgi:hypothetical protein
VGGENDDRHGGQKAFGLETLEKLLSASTGHLPIAECKVGRICLKQGDSFFSVRCDEGVVALIRQQFPERLPKVVIIAAFCMYNRYVDGLATWAPQEQEAYIPMGARMAHEGYVTTPVENPAPHPEALTV